MGVGGWHLNLGELTASTHVLAKDWLGCGLSSRPRWELEGVEETEAFFVESLERYVCVWVGGCTCVCMLQVQVWLVCPLAHVVPLVMIECHSLHLCVVARYTDCLLLVVFRMYGWKPVDRL